MPFLARNNGEIYYEVKGEGEPLVLLRGLGRSTRYWLDYDEYMSNFFKVVIVDHRGIGKTTVPLSWQTKIEDMAGDVVSVLDHLEIESAHIFGLSLGGMVALAMGAVYPEYCQTLMVANSSTADSSPMRIHLKAIRKLAEGAVKGRHHETIMGLVTTKRVEQRIGHTIMSRWQDIMQEEGFPYETIAKQLWAASRFKIKGRIDTVEVPTLILYGNQDQFVPKRNSKKLSHLIPGSQLKILRGVGHEITIGHEELLKDIILRFTKAHPNFDSLAS